MKRSRAHRFIRALTRRAPYLEVNTRWFGRRVVFDDINILLGKLFFDHSEPQWLVSEPVDGVPALVLNVSRRLQRKLFYFPVAWGHHWLRGPLGRLMTATLRPGDVFLDIGANVGMYSLHAANIVGKTGAVRAFEPVPEIFESLRRSARYNGFDQISCHRFALSDENSDAPLYVSWHGGANSLLPEDGRYRGEVRVAVRRLDDEVDDLAIDVRKIALMKIDVEGAEARTIKGMLKTLRGAELPPLWIEVRGPNGSTRAPNTFARVHEQLEPLGYAPHRWRKGALIPVDPSDVVGREDILFQVPN